VENSFSTATNVLRTGHQHQFRRTTSPSAPVLPKRWPIAAGEAEALAHRRRGGEQGWSWPTDQGQGRARSGPRGDRARERFIDPARRPHKGLTRQAPLHGTPRAGRRSPGKGPAGGGRAIQLRPAPAQGLEGATPGRMPVVGRRGAATTSPPRSRMLQPSGSPPLEGRGLQVEVTEGEGGRALFDHGRGLPSSRLRTQQGTSAPLFRRDQGCCPTSATLLPNLSPTPGAWAGLARLPSRVECAGARARS
jgi:hypothetical protein